MPPASSPPVVGEGTNLVSTSIPAITHPALVNIGAQFHQENKTSKTLRIPKVPGPVGDNTNLKDRSSCQNTIERYLHSVDRIEILYVGMQTSLSAQLFDQHLIRMIDDLLPQVEATATQRAIP
ncbi:hypothetical protein EPUS_09011 [Endocarpon pusillum Z07020]|uniref:Uncharacterized protein n=1 Tax=Endocarpon pusillum (strain Z07020 / HMAS-L-300199) TaxID=1263415 RepID=U1I005_ENDPU|nr:uncharacterized protein EPUS_09011 [Endocarpon pusillum Z07020]ERF76530.1 hypothetical protein EPUS_09011 [Endocarpon pusillum Z07020]